MSMSRPDELRAARGMLSRHGVPRARGSEGRRGRSPRLREQPRGFAAEDLSPAVRCIDGSRSGMLGTAAVCSGVVPRGVEPGGAWSKLSLSRELRWTWSQPSLPGLLKLSEEAGAVACCPLS